MVEAKKKYIIREPLRIGKGLESIKVTNMVGTFLKEDSNELWIIRVNSFFNEILKQFQPMNL